jgi:hypothetical protein
VRKPWRKFPVASKASVVAAKKTGQVLVRTLRDPWRAESSVISAKKAGYVRSSELRLLEVPVPSRLRFLPQPHPSRIVIYPEWPRLELHRVRGWIDAMVEAASVLGLLSAGIFLAHALEAYRAR